MIDHLVGRPSPSWKRTQVRRRSLSPRHGNGIDGVNRSFSLYSFGCGESFAGIQGHQGCYGFPESAGRWVRVFRSPDKFAQELSDLNNQPGRFTPWQIIASTLTAVYAVRNFDKILGLPGEWNHSFPIQMLISILKPRSL